MKEFTIGCKIQAPPCLEEQAAIAWWSRLHGVRICWLLWLLWHGEQNDGQETARSFLPEKNRDAANSEDSLLIGNVVFLKLEKCFVLICWCSLQCLAKQSQVFRRFSIKQHYRYLQWLHRLCWRVPLWSSWVVSSTNKTRRQLRVLREGWSVSISWIGLVDGLCLVSCS